MGRKTEKSGNTGKKRAAASRGESAGKQRSPRAPKGSEPAAAADQAEASESRRRHVRPGGARQRPMSLAELKRGGGRPAAQPQGVRLTPSTQAAEAARRRIEPPAKWIGTTDDHSDTPGEHLMTTDRQVIRRWAEEREAVPAMVASAENEGAPMVLRFHFPGVATGNVHEVQWDEWFRVFDQQGLAFVYEAEDEGVRSNFFSFRNVPSSQPKPADSGADAGRKE
jgi:hypothetical protein